MDANSPLDELQWKSPEWINAFGLRTDNVLEYFSQSPFFDRTANNQVLKMQSQFNEQLQNMSPENIAQELKKMKGVEFVVASVREPDFWIIRKQNRTSPTETQPLADYYIIGSSVYMSPAVSSIISSRLLSTVLSLRNSLNILQTLPKFSPSEGHNYNVNIAEGASAVGHPSLLPSKTVTISSTPMVSSGSVAGSNAGFTGNATVSQMVGSTSSTATSATTFNNLLNLSMADNTVYLEDLPLAGVDPTQGTSNLAPPGTTRAKVDSSRVQYSKKPVAR
ncbi:unnamed protein product [Kuraishia capsulata CBS 1993]|uniref:Mediator of RNA polymerase II transcription subunit 6 n=1 Tax=Kuraishia capsulata CBS 1993 TaxID=1382522 RepID=W6MRH3_9ASCO|nr:uncharacterized protein KUCA_T00005339001 [Kuraishia capsulata CBS 1993]CDK29351.1 unnamed protein product [Kuraishia capsulata CBS 1993]